MIALHPSVVSDRDGITSCHCTHSLTHSDYRTQHPPRTELAPPHSPTLCRLSRHGPPPPAFIPVLAALLTSRHKSELDTFHGTLDVTILRQRYLSTESPTLSAHRRLATLLPRPTSWTAAHRYSPYHRSGDPIMPRRTRLNTPTLRATIPD
ncbi:hypothetical protein J6590_015185 [Homalodisca vitripennis]|nr:hypothetical protein J6590_015185 [Homalodisca vitripennis]